MQQKPAGVRLATRGTVHHEACTDSLLPITQKPRKSSPTSAKQMLPAVQDPPVCLSPTPQLEVISSWNIPPRYVRGN